MKKLFVFCLLASFTLATSAMACSENEFPLKSCPKHAECLCCKSAILGSAPIAERCKITSCKTGYKLKNNKCIKVGGFEDKLDQKKAEKTITTKSVSSKR